MTTSAQMTSMPLMALSGLGDEALRMMGVAGVGPAGGAGAGLSAPYRLDHGGPAGVQGR
jgi:hypothetical protein